MRKKKSIILPFLFWGGIVLIIVGYWVPNETPFNKTGWALVFMALIASFINVLDEKSKGK